MTWFKVDDKFWGHPKVASLSFAARGLWVTLGSYCADHLTDGVVTRDVMRLVGAPLKLVNELSSARLLHEHGTKNARGWNEFYSVHDWESYQPTRSEVEANRRNARERKRKSRISPADVTAHVTCDKNESGLTLTRPDPTRPVPGSTNVDLNLQGGATDPPANEDITVVAKVPSPKRPKSPKSPKSAPVWEAYREAYQARYGVEPTRNARVNGQLAQFVQRLPEADAPAVAAAYVAHHDPWYVKNGHSVGYLLRDAEKLHMEWQRGRPVTRGDAREAGRDDEMRAQSERVERLMEGWG